MSTSWKSGLGLAVLMAVAGTATAQPRGDFKKPFDGGPRGGTEVERVRSDMKALESSIDRLRGQIDEMSRKLERAGAVEAKGKGKSGPPDGARGFEKKGFDKKGPPQTAKAPEPKDFKGGPWGNPDWRKAFEEKMRAAQQGKGGPPAGWGPPGRGRFPAPPASTMRPSAPTPPARPQPERSASRASSSDLESRVDRIERAIEELRREIRTRR